MNQALQVPKIYLASKSPRRQQLLKQIGINFTLLSIDIDEAPKISETALETARRLADEKALAGWNNPKRRESIPVLAADTLGLLDSDLLMKPKNKLDAVAMLNKMSGREHQIITAVSVCFDGEIKRIESVSLVRFCHLSETEIDQYWDTGEPADKAGSYAIQGQAARFIESIEGSYSGIVGLPLQQTWNLLQQFNT